MAEISLKLGEVICELVKGQGANPVEYEVGLSNGKVLTGALSPLDPKADHIRVNPLPMNSGEFSYFGLVSRICG